MLHAEALSIEVDVDAGNLSVDLHTEEVEDCEGLGKEGHRRYNGGVPVTCSHYLHLKSPPFAFR